MKDIIPFKTFIDKFGGQRPFARYVRSLGIQISDASIHHWYVGIKYPSIPMSTTLLRIIETIPDDKKINLTIMDLSNPPKRQQEIDNKIIKSLISRAN